MKSDKITKLTYYLQVNSNLNSLLWCNAYTPGPWNISSMLTFCRKGQFLNAISIAHSWPSTDPSRSPSEMISNY